jgi:hypothetical protein
LAPPVAEVDDLALEADDPESAVAFLSRLTVAVATGKLPADVGRWAVDVCREHLPSIERRMARDRLLRQASYLLSGSAWAKAGRLKREILTARGVRPAYARIRPQETGVRYFVQRALALDPATPASTRQLFRIICD